MNQQPKVNFDPLQFGWKPLLASLLLVLVGWGITALAVDSASREQKLNALLDFNKLAAQLERDISRQFEQPVYGMRGAVGAMHVAGAMQRQQFKAYVDSRTLSVEFPGILGLSYVERVMRPDVAAFEAAQRADGAPDFSLKSVGSAPDLYVVKFFEPGFGNKAALGMDLGSEPAVRATILRAIDTGKPSLGALGPLPGDANQRPGFVFLLPVFATAETPETPDERLTKLRGFMSVHMAADDLMSVALSTAQGGIDFELFDGTEPTAQSLIFSNVSERNRTGVDFTPTDFKANRAVNVETALFVGDRLLLLRTGSNPAFDRESASNIPQLIGFGGALFSLLLAVVVWLLLSGRARAENAARKMTAELDQLLEAQTRDNIKLAQAQREREALAMVMDQHAMVSIADPEGNITDANELFCQTSGYELEELRGQNHRILKSGTHTDAFWASMWKTISVGLVWRNVVCNRAKNGQLYWVDTLISPFFNDEGLDKYVSIRTDITATVLAQRALDAERARLSNIITGTNTGTWEWNINTGELVINERWADILGYDVQELRPATASTWSDRCHPDDLLVAHQRRQQHLEGGLGYFECDLRMRHRDGHWVWIHSAGKVSSWTDGGEPEWMSGTHMDISAQKQAQAQLSEQLQFVEVLLEATPVAIFIKNREGNYLRFNKAFEELMGIQRNDWLGKTVFDLVPHDQAVVMDKKDQQLYLEGGLQTYETQFLRHNDGETRQAAFRKAVLHNQEGEVVGLVGAIQDITERNRIASDLHTAMQEVQTATVAKGQFLANMSHEIRTPMNAILGLLSLLQNTDQTAQQMDYTSKTLGAAKSLLGLLNDILDFSKMDAGKMALDPQPFRVDALLRDLSVILSANIGKKSLEVLFDIAPDVPDSLLGDAMRLQQVLTNLSSNAIKFTAHGEVRIQITLLAQQADGCRLRFAVSDTGIGISADNQRHIFDGFSQAEASTTRRFGGTGLGLTISRQLVTLMGGELLVDSVPDEGSTFHFTITLPEAALAEPATATALDVAGHIPEQFRVLVVDDYPAARHILTTLTASLGWQVDAAASGAEALGQFGARAAADQPGYQAVFIDWQMPDMDGWETIRRIQELIPPQGTAPIMIMVTTMGRDMLSKRTPQEQSSLHSFLSKPVTAPMLRDSVRDALAGRSNMRSRTRLQLDRVQPLKGFRLLVVEDNPINQQVARELLTNEGALVEIAANGQLGVEAVAQASPPFDAVLMDLQMPVMDGFAATHAIRHELGLTQLPIIAMTANAMASDREACLATGMNEHIGKPFNLKQLIQLLCRLITEPRGSNPAPELATPSPSSSAAEPSAIDQALDRLGGNRSLYGRTLTAFLAELAPLPNQLGDLLLSRDWAEAIRLLHTIKGLSATVGASALAEVARQAETQLKVTLADGSSFAPEALHATFSAAVARTQVQMRALSEQFNTAATAAAAQDTQTKAGANDPVALTPHDQTTLVAELKQLLALLQTSDMQALEVHARLHQSHALQLGQALAPLAASMAAFDFPQAVVQCTTLLSQLSPAH